MTGSQGIQKEYLEFIAHVLIVHMKKASGKWSGSIGVESYLCLGCTNELSTLGASLQRSIARQGGV